MIANYGYLDGSGEFFISVDTDKCTTCSHYACVEACPPKIFEIISDDYDDRVAAVKEGFRKQIKYACAPCKPASERPPLPCMVACTPGALKHSW